MPEEETIIVNPVEEGQDTTFPSLDLAKFEKQMKAFNSYSALQKFRNETGVSPAFDLNTLGAYTSGNLLDLKNYGTSKFSVDFAGKTTVATPTAATHAATKAYADTKTTLTAVKADTDVASAISLKHTQNTDTALGAQSGNLNMNTHKVVSVVDPTSAQDAATKKYVDDNKTPVPVAGDSMLLASADTERFTIELSYTLLKEIQIGKTGTYRIKWQMRNGDDLTGSPWVKTKIYVNDSPAGAEKTTYVGTYNDYEETSFSINAGEKIELYGYVQWFNQYDGYPKCTVRNFRISALEFDITSVITN